MATSSPVSPMNGKGLDPLARLDRLIETLTPTTAPHILGDLSSFRDDYRLVSESLGQLFGKRQIQHPVPAEKGEKDVATIKPPSVKKATKSSRNATKKKTGRPAARTTKATTVVSAKGRAATSRRTPNQGYPSVAHEPADLTPILEDVLGRPEYEKGLMFTELAKIIKSENLYTTKGNLDDEIYDGIRILRQAKKVLRGNGRRYLKARQEEAAPV